MRSDPKPARVRTVIPILAVTDVEASAPYWRARLGFNVPYIIGNPIRSVWVRRDDVNLQLDQNPELAASAEGSSFILTVAHISGLYEWHQQSGAEIVSSLAPLPTGGVEYVVRELNGYRLHFRGAAPPASVAKTLPATVRLVQRPLTPAEYSDLYTAVGWGTLVEGVAARAIADARYCVVAEAESVGTVGGLVVLPVGSVDLHLRDIMVKPEWQGQRVGSALMEAFCSWLTENAESDAIVHLNTDESLTPFYEPFGFRSGFGMTRRVVR